MPTTRWRLLRHLDWPRFLRAFFFVDVANLVLPVWELVRRSTGGGGDTIDEIRDLCTVARFEMDQLLQEAGERAG